MSSTASSALAEGGIKELSSLQAAVAGRATAGTVSPAAPIRLVLASANPDKVREIAAVLGDALDVELLPRPPEVPDVVEDGETLLDNARLKARALVAATGTAAVADDTGLEVDALGGAPGVYSARYAGEGVTYADNVTKLLADLAALPDGGGERRARFRTVALVTFPDGGEIWAEGAVEGSISDGAKGDGGFGYDPVFVPSDGDGRTFAEMSAAEKHDVSHRGRAFRALAAALAQRAELSLRAQLASADSGRLQRREAEQPQGRLAHEGVGRPGGEREIAGGRTGPLHGEERMVGGVEHAPEAP